MCLYSIAALPSISDLEITSTPPSTFTVSWSEYIIPGVTVKYYYVCIRTDPASTDCDSEVVLDPSVLSYTISDLSSGVYYLTVYADTVEYGRITESGTFTLTVTGPPAAVENFAAVVISSSEIYYTWDEYVLLEGDLVGYVICLKKDLSQTGCDNLGNLGPLDTSYSATGLDSCTVYYASIFAQTSFGTSLESDIVSTSTQGGGESMCINIIWYLYRLCGSRTFPLVNGCCF